MRLRAPIRVCVLTGLAAFLTAAFSFSVAAEAKIVIGQSIAGVKLGATPTRVEKLLGKPDATTGAWTYYDKHKVGFVFTAFSFNAGHVYQLYTNSPRQRTSKGIGVNSTLKRVRAAYPKMQCAVGPFTRTICEQLSHFKGQTIGTVLQLISGEVTSVTIGVTTPL